MKQHLFAYRRLVLCLLGLSSLLFFVLQAGAKEVKGVKTSYKQYTIFQYKNQDILCEPYTVQKNDWLYKILRKKGEISERDFPFFLRIFKKLNPKISNIDAIKAGYTIIIPLKKVKKKDYELSKTAAINVPMIEFSTLPDRKMLEPFMKKHKIKYGESISGLMDKAFLSRGMITREGVKALQLTNPKIKNINIIYEGANIYLPDASITTQQWFKDYLAGKPQKKKPEPQPPAEPVKVDKSKLIQLQQYADLTGDRLMSRGKMYFPGDDGTTTELDLSAMPVIEGKDGSKTLVLSEENQKDPAIYETAQKYWKNLKIKKMSDTLKDLQTSERIKTARKFNSAPNLTLIYKNRVKELIAHTEYDYIPNTKIPFTINSIELQAVFGRVVRKNQPDLLINFGNVYGKALDILNKTDYDIISITPKLKTLELSKTLFSNLGYSTWVSPSFYTGEKIEIVKGIYAVKGDTKLFIPEEQLHATAISYLEKENIKITSASPFIDAIK